MPKRLAAAAAALAAIWVQPAPAAQDGGRDRPQHYVAITDPSVLVGHYHFQEGAFAIDVHLNADRSALYTVSTDGGRGGIRAEGLWRVDGEEIHIYNHPGPVRLDRAAPAILDRSVVLAVVATLADGSPAEGLAITWRGADALFYMSAGRHTTARGERPIRGTVYILRESDSTELASFRIGPGMPNSHRFIYSPSDPEPFDIKAGAMDPRADVIMVEAGSAGAPLRRVRD